MLIKLTKQNQVITNLQHKDYPLFLKDLNDQTIIFDNCSLGELNIINCINSTIKIINCTMDILQLKNSDLVDLTIKICNTCSVRISHSSIYQLNIKNCNFDYLNIISAQIHDFVCYQSSIESLYFEKTRADGNFNLSKIPKLTANFSTVYLTNYNRLSGLKYSSFHNCDFQYLSNINLGILSLIPIHSILLSNWGRLSPELTSLCMAYDAQNHPEPSKFTDWAKGGPCPYNNISLNRAVLFLEDSTLWKPELLNTPINTIDLIKKLFAEKNIQANWDKV